MEELAEALDRLALEAQPRVAEREDREDAHVPSIRDRPSGDPAAAQPALGGPSARGSSGSSGAPRLAAGARRPRRRASAAAARRPRRRDGGARRRGAASARRRWLPTSSVTSAARWANGTGLLAGHRGQLGRLGRHVARDGRRLGGDPVDHLLELASHSRAWAAAALGAGLLVGRLRRRPSAGAGSGSGGRVVSSVIGRLLVRDRHSPARSADRPRALRDRRPRPAATGGSPGRRRPTRAARVAVEERARDRRPRRTTLKRQRPAAARHVGRGGPGHRRRRGRAPRPRARRRSAIARAAARAASRSSRPTVSLIVAPYGGAPKRSRAASSAS